MENHALARDKLKMRREIKSQYMRNEQAESEWG